MTADAHHHPNVLGDPRFSSGDTVTHREVWRGRPWAVRPAIVVRDEPDLVALYRPLGTQGMSPVDADGRAWRVVHDWWHAPVTWTDRHQLMLAEPGRPWSIWLMWDEAWTFRNWYVNIELPWRRTAIGFDTMDHELDIVVQPNRSWQWKDEDVLQEWVQGGAHTPEEAATFREHELQVIRERIEPWAAPFGDEWPQWRPDPTWTLPELSPGWELPNPSPPARG